MATLALEKPTQDYDPEALFPPWQTVFPFLREIQSQWKVVCDECARARWTDWPEFNLYHPEQGQAWRVAPFLYTIPADDDANAVWIQSTVDQCPQTASLLRRIPGIRTALFSQMGPSTSLAPHQGWASLSNHVLRCHLSLIIPRGDEAQGGAPISGVVVDDQICAHAEGGLLVFDDSKVHSAFNQSSTHARVVLIFDVVRPAEARPGIATGGTTAELESFMDYFR